MSREWLDLLAGAPVDFDRAADLPGLWRLEDHDGASELQVNGVDGIAGDRLVAAADGTWTLRLHDGQVRQGSIPAYHAPSVLDHDALEQMEQLFAARRSARWAWDRWSSSSPLAPRLGDFLRFDGFDRDIDELLEFLEEVCSRPRSQLTVESDLVPTARARRVAPQAITRFVSHREDWERPTVVGVRPRRLLCLVTDETLDQYENRVAVRLVDHLRRYLAWRLEQLRGIHRMLLEFGKSTGLTSDLVNHRRTHRLFRLWAEAYATSSGEGPESENADSANELAERTRARIDGLLRRVMRLVDSRLYRSIPRNVRVAGLRRTNVFSSDPNYRKVAELWERWERRGRRKTPSEEEYLDLQQRLCDGMSWFSMQLLVRALVQLRFHPTTASCRDSIDHEPIELERRSAAGDPEEPEYPHRLTLTPPSDGVIILKTDTCSIRVVAIPTRLDRESQIERPDLRTRLLRSAKAAAERQVLLLHLPASGDVSQQADASTAEQSEIDASRLWEPGTGEADKLATLAVSPWDIGSVERVTRYLRWQIDAALLLSYPPILCDVTIPKSIRRPEYLKQGDRAGQWKLIRPPEGTAIPPKELVDAIYEDALAAQNRSGGKVAQRAIEFASNQRLDAWKAIEMAITHLGALRLCPTCGEKDGRFRTDGEGDSYEVQCHACQSVWGLYRCKCTKRFPILKIHRFEELATSSCHDAPDWIDRVFGADVMSVPCRRTELMSTIVCPHCKRCACTHA